MSNRPGFRGLRRPCPLPSFSSLCLPFVVPRPNFFPPPAPIRLHCSAALGWCSRDVNENGQSPPPPFLTWSPRRESRSVGWVWWGECPTHRPPTLPLLSSSMALTDAPPSRSGGRALSHTPLCQSLVWGGRGGQSQGTEGRAIDQMKMEREEMLSPKEREQKFPKEEVFSRPRAHLLRRNIY